MICIPILSICLNFYTYYFWVSFLFKILQWQKKTSKIYHYYQHSDITFQKDMRKLKFLVYKHFKINKI